MKVSPILLAFFLTAMPWSATACSVQSAAEEAYLESMGRAGGMGEPATASDPESVFYAKGTRAINDWRWSDAISIFKKIAEEHGEHADGALYWIAYAENKQGQTKEALETCVELRRDYPRSRWVDECGALEIEIRSRSGQPVQLEPTRDEELKLLALNSLMRQDEARALAQIEKILKGDSSEGLKERAVFILTQGQSKRAQNLLAEIALGRFNPAHPDPALQAKAAGLRLGLPGDASEASHPAPPITLDVVVTDKSGAPVAGLEPQDFKLFDNKKPQILGSVKTMDGMTAHAEPPVEIYLVLDAVNMSFQARSYQRQLLLDLFNANGKQLALPTSLLVLTDHYGLEEKIAPTRDGNALLRVLDSSYAGLRQIEKYQGLDGAVMREQDSLKALNLFALQQSKRPGRKLVIWLGVGWDVTSNRMYYGGPAKMRKIYASIAAMSTALRNAQITLYTVAPISGIPRDYGYQQYVRGVSDPKQVDIGDFLLPVLSEQTGGLVLTGSSDMPALINQCIADARVYYRITFTPPPTRNSDEYHSIDVVVDKPGLKARTRTGYYAQPPAQAAPSLSEAAVGKPAD